MDVTRGPAWSEDEIDTLMELLGTMSDAALAKRLGRTPEAVRIKWTRLGLNRKQNFLCAREVGRILGIDSKRVPDLIGWGVLAGKPSSVRAGSSRAWRIEVEALERFLKRHPEWYDPARIIDEPWRSLARGAWAKLQPLTVEQTAAELGVNPETVRRHLRNGWLAGVLAKNKGNNGVWFIRQSALTTFKRRQLSRVVLRSVGGVNGQKPATKRPTRLRRGRVRDADRCSVVQPARFQPVTWRAS